MPCDELGDVGGAGACCVHDGVDIETAPVGQSDCSSAPVGTSADVTDRGAGPELGAECNGLDRVAIGRAARCRLAAFWA